MISYFLSLRHTLLESPVWRNGRRSRLKICRGQPRAGSSPATGIQKQHLKLLFRSFRCCFIYIHRLTFKKTASFEKTALMAHISFFIISRKSFLSLFSLQTLDHICFLHIIKTTNGYQNRY